MNCKQVKEFLLTDYLDGQLTEHRIEKVENHLSACNECKEYALMTKQSFIEPFRNLKRGKPSEGVWLKIKNKIQQEEEVEKIHVEHTSLIKKLRGLFVLPKPVYIFSTMVILIMLFVGPFFNDKKSVNVQNVSISAEEQVNQLEYINHLVTDNGVSTDNGFNDYGESIEEFFLSKL